MQFKTNQYFLKAFFVILLNICITNFAFADTAIAARTNACTSLFSSVQKSSLIFKYEKIAKYARAQKVESLDQVTLRIEGHVFETLQWMLSEIESIRADIHLSKEQNESLISGVNKLKSDLQINLSKDTINHYEFLRLSERTATALNFKFVTRLPGFEYRDRSAMGFENEIKSLLRGLNGEVKNNVIWDATNTLKFFFLPTTKSLGIKSMNALHAKGIAVLGLTNKLETVDNRTFLPLSYFSHDSSHATGYERQPYTYDYTGPTVKKIQYAPLNPTLKASEREQFYEQFESFVSRSSNSSRSEEIYHALWFLTFHEGGLPIHPKNLKSDLTKILSEKWGNGDLLDAMLERLNNPKDLGYTFRDSPVKKEELRSAIQSLISFAEGHITP